MIKRLPAMRETRDWSLGGEDPLKKEMATHSSTLAWKIQARMEEPCMGHKESDMTERLHFLFFLSTQWFLSSVQSLSRVQLFVTPWTAACQASLSITNSQNLPKLMSIESVMPSNHLILCCPLLLLPSIFPSIKVFSNESALHIRWPKYWSFSFNISPSNEHSGLIFWFSLGWTGWISLQWFLLLYLFIIFWW